MSFEIKNKVAFVTGGAGGLGYHFVRVLLENGAKGVVFLDVNETKGRETENGLRKEFGDESCAFVKCDVSDEAQMKDAFEFTIKSYNQLDIVINNAGVLTDTDWKACVSTNLVGCILGTTMAIDHYLPKYKTGEGIIVNISSISGIMPFGMVPIYSSTKHGVVALTRCYGQKEHYDRSGVKIVCICPGQMDTPMNQNLSDKSFNPDYHMAYRLSSDVYPIQKAEVVAQQLPELMSSAPNGSVWIIENSQPPYEAVYSNPRRDCVA